MFVWGFLQTSIDGSHNLNVITVYIDHIRGKPVILFGGGEGGRGRYGPDKLTPKTDILPRVSASQRKTMDEGLAEGPVRKDSPYPPLLSVPLGKRFQSKLPKFNMAPFSTGTLWTNKDKTQHDDTKFYERFSV